MNNIPRREVNKTAFPDYPLDVSKIGPRIWRLNKQWTYRCGSGLVVIVPAGFETDFASIPRAAWPYVGAPADSAEAAIPHDYIYSKRAASVACVPGLSAYLELEGNPSTRHNQGVIRQWADSMYKDALKDLGVGRVNRYAQYRAVRWFGWLIWYYRRGRSECSGG